MKFSISFELQGTQETPLCKLEREKLEKKVHKKLKQIIEVVPIDERVVLRKKINTLEVDLI